MSLHSGTKCPWYPKYSIDDLDFVDRTRVELGEKYLSLIYKFSETLPILSETRIDELGAELPLGSRNGRLGTEEADMPKRRRGGRRRRRGPTPGSPGTSGRRSRGCSTVRGAAGRSRGSSGGRRRRWPTRPRGTGSSRRRARSRASRRRRTSRARASGCSAGRGAATATARPGSAPSR